ncbi:MAG: hypothetical protein RL174_71 [Actinomycetota bacterium]|jgi:hypothetical protein
MLAFIDDSGDAGFKFENGSSRHLVIACCVFETDVAAERANFAIRDFKTRANWPVERELKFHNLREDLKLEFLAFSAELNFTLRAIVFDKGALDFQRLDTRGAPFYLFAIAQLISSSSDILIESRIHIDGRVSRETARASSKYIKEVSNNDAAVVAKIKFVDSQPNNLIQLADMCAGAIRRSQETNHTKQNLYLSALQPLLQRHKSEITFF